MFGVRPTRIFYAEIINNQGEKYWFPFVPPLARHVATRGVSFGIQLIYKLVVY